MSFCHLHVHSNFTFGEGSSSLEDLVLKGYSNLCHLVSEMHLSSEDEPRLKIEILEGKIIPPDFTLPKGEKALNLRKI